MDESTRMMTDMKTLGFSEYECKAHYEKLFEELSQYAGDLYQEPKQDDKLAVISGRENIISFLKLLIQGAQKRVAVSIWEEEIKELKVELDAALDTATYKHFENFADNVHDYYFKNLG